MATREYKKQKKDERQAMKDELDAINSLDRFPFTDSQRQHHQGGLYGRHPHLQLGMVVDKYLIHSTLNTSACSENDAG